ncbi:MAG: M48 family metalloprotease [Aquificota bacterium]|nr:M48 family metalloprotease [Aquificota bacterium]
MRKFLLSVLVLLLSCAPLSETIQHAILPPEEEIRIGRSYVPYAIAENEGLYPDPQVQEYVRSLGEKLSKLSPRKVPYRFYVVNSSVQNAFALPGGPVFITRGLLLMLENESELASVLGHEIGHIGRRHHARYLEKVLGLSLLLRVTAVLVGDRGASSQILLQVANIGANLLALKFSRDQEREADAFGVGLVAKAGYDPKGFVGLFEKFRKIQKERPPAWLSTHPLPEERIRNVSRMIANYRKPGMRVDSAEFRKVKEKILSTKRSFDLYEEGKRLFREGKKDLALEKFRKSLEVFERNQMAHIYIAVILTDRGRHKEALKHATEAVRIDPDLLWARFVRGVVLFNTGSYRESLKELERARQLVPAFPDTYYYLGRNLEALGRLKEALKNYERALSLARGDEPWLGDARERYERLRRYVW